MSPLIRLAVGETRHHRPDEEETPDRIWPYAKWMHFVSAQDASCHERY